MIGNYKRVLVATLSTTLLHASLFYTLSEVKQPKIVQNKTIEIELMQAPKEEKKEVAKVKVVEKPKPIVEPEKPKPTLKPKPIVKQTPKPTVEPKVVPKPIEVKKELSEEVIKKEVIDEKIVEQKKAQNTDNMAKAQDNQTTSSANADILEMYLYSVRVKIQNNLRYPPLARRLKIQGESVISFNILSDGSVEASTIKTHKSSGNSSLDNRAMDTILQVSPFDAPPEGKISIIVPVAFNLK